MPAVEGVARGWLPLSGSFLALISDLRSWCEGGGVLAGYARQNTPLSSLLRNFKINNGK